MDGFHYNLAFKFIHLDELNTDSRYLMTPIKIT